MNLQPSTAAARHAMKRRIQLKAQRILRRCARTGSPVLNSERVRRSIWADAALLLAALYSSAWLLLESEQVGLLYEFSGCRVCCVCVCVTCGSFACAYLLAADPDPCPHFPALHDICSSGHCHIHLSRSSCPSANGVLLSSCGGSRANWMELLLCVCVRSFSHLPAVCPRSITPWTCVHCCSAGVGDLVLQHWLVVGHFFAGICLSLS